MRKQMAHRDRIAWLPGDHYVHDGDLDFTFGERARLLAGYALALLAALAIVLVLSLPGKP